MLKKAYVQKKRSHLKKRAADEDPGHKNKSFNFFKRKALLIAVLVMAAVAIPVISMAAGTNKIEQIAEIPLQQSASPTPSEYPLTSKSWSLPAASDGELTSELTDSTTQAVQEASPAPTPVVTPDAAPVPDTMPESLYTTFSSGMDDPFVSQIQQRLMDLDYMEQDEPSTLFGPITSQAIEYFQRKNELPVDGIAGTQTQELLFSENAKYYTVLEGTTGPDVESMQERLKELGYSVKDTGYFGSDTAKAVAYFQRMNGLTDDGNVGSQTREALYSKEAEPSQEFGKKKPSSDSKNSSSANNDIDSKASAPAPAANPGDVEAFVQAALSQLGKKYVWGGKGPDVFDCSGFIYHALKISGNGIDYMTSAGWHNSGYTKIERMEDLQRGDIIDYKGHVGIYLGDGTMVDASSSEGKVRISGNIFNSKYWTSNFLEGRRVF